MSEIKINVPKGIPRPHTPIKKAEEEPEIRPEYVEKIRQIEKKNKKPIPIKNIDDLFIDE